MKYLAIIPTAAASIGMLIADLALAKASDEAPTSQVAIAIPLEGRAQLESFLPPSAAGFSILPANTAPQGLFLPSRDSIPGRIMLSDMSLIIVAAQKAAPIAPEMTPPKRKPTLKLRTKASAKVRLSPPTTEPWWRRLLWFRIN
jgi:hypothetical protein